MIIYVESNFILELALEQEQYQSCEAILEICESGKGSLVIPAFCIVEPYHTLERRAKERNQFQIQKAFNNQLTLLAETKSYQKEINHLLNDLTSILAKSIEEENRRFHQVLNKLLKIAELIPLENTIITNATELQSRSKLKLADAIVYASILQHLMKTGTDYKCFLSQDKDFDDPDIKEKLEKYNCKMRSKFVDGFNYIQHQVQSKMPA